MTERGWNEAFRYARESDKTPNRWTMLDHKDLVLSDGQRLICGDNAFIALETPGHTWGTASYLYDARHGGKSYRAVTVGGQGLNAIDGPEQVRAYIRSMNRLSDDALNVQVDLTAHPFSTGLTEKYPPSGRSRLPIPIRWSIARPISPVWRASTTEPKPDSKKNWPRPPDKRRRRLPPARGPRAATRSSCVPTIEERARLSAPDVRPPLRGRRISGRVLDRTPAARSPRTGGFRRASDRDQGRVRMSLAPPSSSTPLSYMDTSHVSS